MLDALDVAYSEIRQIQTAAREGSPPERPSWPMIVLRSPKGWTGIKEIDGTKIEGTSKAHQVPAIEARTNPVHLRALEEWLRSYEPRDLFDADGRPVAELLSACPTGDSRMGANPHATGGRVRTPLDLPDPAQHACEVSSPGVDTSSAMNALGSYLADVFARNAEQKNFRIMCPDEVASNRLNPVFEVEDHAYVWPLDPEIDVGPPSYGRIMEILSEHNCQGWLQGYLLTGRHGVFPCYEAFIPIVEGMANQYAKFLKMSRDEAPWRPPVASLNYLLSSVGWREDHNGYSHQMPGLIKLDAQPQGTPGARRPPAGHEHAARDDGRVSPVDEPDQPRHRVEAPSAAMAHDERGAGALERRGIGLGLGRQPDDGRPDVVLASAGTIPTTELLATAKILREEVPELKVRFVNAIDLLSLAIPSHHPSGMSPGQFSAVFTEDRPVVFNFHGYPSAVHQLIHRRPQQTRFHVRGYVEEGTTTTPFDLLAMNGVDRYQPAVEALSRADILAAEMLHGLSGEFAARPIPDAEAAISKFREKLQKARLYARQHGTDAPEVTDWTWA